MLAEGGKGGKMPHRPMKSTPKKKRILIVEDDALVRESVKNLLEKGGYEVRLAPLGVAALDPAFMEVLDLVIADIRMPGMNGLETIKAIREVRRQFGKPAIPEIILTAYDDEPVKKEAGRMEIRAFILKPFEAKSFLGVVRKKLKSASQTLSVGQT